MTKSALIGMLVLAAVWVWLAWLLLSTSGINLKNLLLLAMTAVIIFVPLYRKYGPARKNEKHD